MANLSYNGIDLDILRTTRWTRDAVYSDDGADYLYTKHVIEVTAIYNPYSTGYESQDDGEPQPVDPDVSPPRPSGVRDLAVGPSPASSDKAIRHFLMQPRQSLIFTNPPLVVGEDPEELLISPDADKEDVTDAHFGPRPLYCHVKEIIGSRTFFVVYGIEVCVIECPNDAQLPAVLSLRWSETHDIDSQYFTTRTISGRVKFRTDVLTNPLMTPSIDFKGRPIDWNGLADDFRSQLFHPVLDNFKRESIRVVATSDGSELLYEIVDKEVYLSIGANDPATKYDGFLSLSTMKNSGGAVLYASVKVHAVGSPKSNKKDLWTRCVQIADAKLNFDKNTFVTQASVVEDIFNPVVELDVTVMLASPQVNADLKINLGPDGPDNIEFMANGVGELFNAAVTKNKNPTPTGDGISRGAWVGVAAAAAYATACKVDTESQTTIEADPDDDETELTTEPTIEVSVTSTLTPLQDSDNHYSDLTQDGIWTHYTLDTAYRRNEGVYAAPVASQDEDAATEYVTLHAPTTMKTVAWRGERVGDWPTYPDTDDGDENTVLLRSEIVGSGVEPLQDGDSLKYTVRGVYYYGCIKPVAPGDSLTVGQLPTVSGVDGAIPGDKMDNAILQNNTPTSLGGGPFSGSLPGDAPLGVGGLSLPLGSVGGGNTGSSGGSGGGSGGGGPGGGLQ